MDEKVRRVRAFGDGTAGIDAGAGRTGKSSGEDAPEMGDNTGIGDSYWNTGTPVSWGGKVSRADILTTVKNLRPIDDVLFQKLAEREDVVQEMLRVILEDPGLRVLSVVQQNSIKNLFGRSVLLDALCELSDIGKCNIEVQKADNTDHLKRVRYNASCITANITEPGTKFENVPNVCVVFLSDFDIFEKNRTVYHVVSTIKETSTCVEDGLQRIFVNTKVNDNSDTAELMKCFTQTEVHSSKFTALSEAVGYFKSDEKGVGAMCASVESLIRTATEAERAAKEAERAAREKAERAAEANAAEVKRLRAKLMALGINP